MFRKSTYILLFLFILNFIYPLAIQGMNCTARSALLIEEKSGRILYNKNSTEELPMASTTKIMTAITAIEYGDLSEQVIIDDITPKIEGSSLYLKENDIISLEDLIYGLLLQSGNDAADAVAKHVVGSEENFITLMNEKARMIGAVNTNFKNPHGLHDKDHYTTAKDLALITQYAFNNDIFKEIVGTIKREITINNEKRVIFNKNRLVTEYEGGNGVKTGYTVDAGKCLVFSAERDDMLLVGVLIDSANIWTDSKILLDYGFNHYNLKNVLRKNEYLGSIYIDSGIMDTLKIFSNEDVAIPISEGESIETKLNLNKNLKAPIFHHQQIGSLDFYINDNLVYQKQLFSPQKVYEKNFIKFFLENINTYFNTI
ncbi:MAG: D-alanyl-D-alanine carboxypeptidase family protein [Eubacteriales bacterium]